MRPIIAFNWKCNPTSAAIVSDLIKSADKEGVILCPSFIDIPEAAKRLKKAAVGAQDVYLEEGAYTGEISPKMLKRAGASYVIIGHSERRSVIGESEMLIRDKLSAVLSSGLKAILCIGETQEDRSSGISEDVVRGQFISAVSGIDSKLLSKVIVAYEPVWAIGTGLAASADDASAAAAFIKSLGFEAGISKLSVLYGGSVSSKNAKDFIEAKSVDGILVGGASLKTSEVKGILVSVLAPEKKRKAKR